MSDITNNEENVEVGVTAEAPAPAVVATPAVAETPAAAPAERKGPVVKAPVVKESKVVAVARRTTRRSVTVCASKRPVRCPSSSAGA